MANTWVEAWCFTALSPRVFRSVSVMCMLVVRALAVATSGDGSLGLLLPVGICVDCSGVAL